MEWSIDFVRDSLANGRVFRDFTVVDDFTRECPAIETFNGKLRDECLNESYFVNLRDAQLTIEVWRTDYNDTRPHCSLGS